MPLITHRQLPDIRPRVGFVLALAAMLVAAAVAAVPFATRIDYETESGDWSLSAEWRKPSLYYAAWNAGDGMREWRLQLGCGYYCLQRIGD